MKKLFLSSSFKDVAPLFEAFAGEEVKGKTVTFIPTAARVEKIRFYVGSAKKAFAKMDVTVDELDLAAATPDEIERKLTANDYIYVSGGNTFYLLQELKKSGADKIIAHEIAAGKLYIGESAGSMVASPDIEYAQPMDDRRKAPELETFAALGIVDFHPVPHQGNFPFTGAVENILAEYGSRLPLRPISNAQVILVEDGKMRIESRQTNSNHD